MYKEIFDWQPARIVEMRSNFNSEEQQEYERRSSKQVEFLYVVFHGARPNRRAIRYSKKPHIRAY